MNKITKRILIGIFIIIAIASLMLLVKFGSGGGPCNAGLILILLGPIIIMSAIVQIVIFNLSTSIEKTWIRFRRIISMIFSCGWIYLTVIFSDDGSNAFTYLIPILVLNLTITILIFIKFRAIDK